MHKIERGQKNKKKLKKEIVVVVVVVVMPIVTSVAVYGNMLFVNLNIL